MKLSQSVSSRDSARLLTVGELFEMYRALILSKVSPGTGRGYMVAWRRRVAPRFAAVDVASLTALDVEAAFAEWSGAYSTRVDALALLSRICQVAVKAGVIASNPCIGIERPRVQGSDPTERALSLGQVRRLLDLLPASGPYRRAVLAMLYTGCRLGEVAALRLSDVDWQAGTITVRHSASAGFTGQVQVGPTKGRRVRSVPIAAPFLPILREAAAGKGPHDRLFTGPREGYLNSKNLSRALGWPALRRQIKTFAPGEKALRFHDLRHTAAVFLFLAGVSAPDVQAILGHSSLAVTRLYANTRADAAKRGAAALSRFYDQESNDSPGGGEAAAETASDLGLSVVAPTGIDPVTFRFSVERSTN